MTAPTDEERYIGSELSAALSELDISVREISSAAGLSRSHLYNLLDNRRPAGVETLSKLSLLLQRPIGGVLPKGVPPTNGVVDARGQFKGQPTHDGQQRVSVQGEG